MIRGSDHRPNLEVQRRIARALGGELPEVIHHGLVLGPDGKKLSKRHGHASIADLRDGGSRRSAVRAYLDELGLPAHDVQLDLPRLRRLAIDAIAAMSDEELTAGGGGAARGRARPARCALARRGSGVRAAVAAPAASAPARRRADARALRELRAGAPKWLASEGGEDARAGAEGRRRQPACPTARADRGST